MPMMIYVFAKTFTILFLLRYWNELTGQISVLLVRKSYFPTFVNLASLSHDFLSAVDLAICGVLVLRVLLLQICL
jgi:hypothetical protein